MHAALESGMTQWSSSSHRGGMEATVAAGLRAWAGAAADGSTHDGEPPVGDIEIRGAARGCFNAFDSAVDGLRVLLHQLWVAVLIALGRGQRRQHSLCPDCWEIIPLDELGELAVCTAGSELWGGVSVRV